MYVGSSYIHNFGGSDYVTDFSGRNYGCPRRDLVDLADARVHYRIPRLCDESSVTSIAGLYYDSLSCVDNGVAMRISGGYTACNISSPPRAVHPSPRGYLLASPAAPIEVFYAFTSASPSQS